MLCCFGRRSPSPEPRVNEPDNETNGELPSPIEFQRENDENRQNTDGKWKSLKSLFQRRNEQTEFNKGNSGFYDSGRYTRYPSPSSGVDADETVLVDLEEESTDLPSTPAQIVDQSTDELPDDTVLVDLEEADGIEKPSTSGQNGINSTDELPVILLNNLEVEDSIGSASSLVESIARSGYANSRAGTTRSASLSDADTSSTCQHCFHCAVDCLCQRKRRPVVSGENLKSASFQEDSPHDNTYRMCNVSSDDLGDGKAKRSKPVGCFGKSKRETAGPDGSSHRIRGDRPEPDGSSNRLGSDMAVPYPGGSHDAQEEPVAPQNRLGELSTLSDDYLFLTRRNKFATENKSCLDSKSLR